MQSHSFLLENLAATQPDLRKRVLLHCLGRSLDLAKGAVSTAIACTPVSLVVISRTMLEELITAQWLCLDPNNAVKHQDNSHATSLKVLREILKGGYAEMVHKESGEDHTQSAVEQLTRKSNMPNIEQRARECKVHRLYTIIYRHLSPLVHGSDFEQPHIPAAAHDAVKIILPAAIVFHKATYDIVTTFLIDGQTTTPADIEKKLKFDYFPIRSL